MNNGVKIELLLLLLFSWVFSWNHLIVMIVCWKLMISSESVLWHLVLHFLKGYFLARENCYSCSPLVPSLTEALNKFCFAYLESSVHKRLRRCERGWSPGVQSPKSTICSCPLLLLYGDEFVTQNHTLIIIKSNTSKNIDYSKKERMDELPWNPSLNFSQ